MMIMSPRLRKFALTVHVACSVGLLGSVATFLALAVIGLTSQEAQLVRAAYPAMEVTAYSVIAPLAFAALLSGLVQALGTTWGLFRHYWVLVKLLLTAVITIILLLQFGSISYLAGVAAERSLAGDEFRDARMSLVIHAGGGLIALLIPLALSLYKPRGTTRYGWRKQHEKRQAT